MKTKLSNLSLLEGVNNNCKQVDVQQTASSSDLITFEELSPKSLSPSSANAILEAGQSFKSLSLSSPNATLNDEQSARSKVGTPVTPDAKLICFTNLPVEIWQEILDYLEVEDAVSLSLCTRDTYQHLGKQAHVLGELIYQDEARLRFLRALHRDMSPYLMLCELCFHMHGVPQRSTSWVTWTNEESRPCFVDDTSERCNCYLHEKFGFGDVQVAAELHRREHAGLGHYLQSLAARYFGWGGTISFINDFEVRVNKADGQVYIRRQEWFSIAVSTWATVPKRTMTFAPCKHVTHDIFHTDHAHELDLAQKGIRHYRTLGYLQSSNAEVNVNRELDWGWTQLMQCQRCETEYRLDFGHVPEASRMCAIVLTKWMCLGDGKSRSEGLWQAYRSETFPGIRTPFEAGTVFAGFEDGKKENEYQPRWTKELASLWATKHGAGKA